jgi:hypothetical protein
MKELSELWKLLSNFDTVEGFWTLEEEEEFPINNFQNSCLYLYLGILIAVLPTCFTSWRYEAWLSKMDSEEKELEILRKSLVFRRETVAYKMSS